MARLHNTLVLTLDGVPIARVSPERAVVLIMQNKAYMIQTQGQEMFHSQRHQVPVPAVIGLTSWYKLPPHYYGHARLSVATLLRRDNWTCQYCGREKRDLKENEFLTRDHVFPASRGGEDRWENVVLSCISCNNRKGDKTPDEAGMTLLRQPFAPSRWQLNRRYLEEAIINPATVFEEMELETDLEAA